MPPRSGGCETISNRNMSSRYIWWWGRGIGDVPSCARGRAGCTTAGGTSRTRPRP
ncbi:hypothetical protein GZL_01225 [Streptomyces sp. 769]|nr:hypothetical protein GZL_01225 [Streptomyces sp. 769]